MGRANIVVLILGVVICGAASPAAAQAGLPVAVDQRVRVWTASAEALTGRVVAIAPDTLRLAVEGRDPVTVPVATVRRVEVSRQSSRGARARKWAIRGAVISGVLGAISLGLQHEQVGENGSSAGKAAALGAFSGGLFGGLIGAGLGAAGGGDRWEQVWP